MAHRFWLTGDLTLSDNCPWNHTSSSWFTSVNRILLKYDLQSACTLLSNPVKKLQWKRLVKETVNTHWRNQVIQQSWLYDQLYHLNVDGYKPGNVHLIVKTQSSNICEVRRISVKVKLATGTYTVQSIRAKFASQPGNGTCLLCKESEETIYHFLFECCILSTVRDLIIQDIDDCLSQQRKTLLDFTPELKLSVLLDATNLSQLIEHCDQSIISNVEHHSRRLCFILHGERHKWLLSQTANGRSGRRTRKY